MKIIQIAGKMGAGKDYLAKKLVDYALDTGRAVVKTAFAWKLKKLVYDNLFVTKKGIDRFHPGCVAGPNPSVMVLNLWEDISKTATGLYGDLWNPSDDFVNHVGELKELEIMVASSLADHENGAEYGRKILQFVGTDIVRKHICDSFWVDYVHQFSDLCQKNTDLFIVADTRFPNEIMIGSTVIKVEAEDIIRAERLKISLDDLKSRSGHASETMVDHIPENFLIKNNLGHIDRDELGKFFEMEGII